MENINDVRQIIAKNLISYRTSAGLTQSELADKINYTDKSISKWERGLGIPDVLVLKDLATLYGIKVDDFLIENENTSKIVLGQSNKKTSRLLITLLSGGLVWFVSTIIFVVLLWCNIDRAWLSFIVAIPAFFIVLIVFSALWGKLWQTCLFVSALVWTVALSGFLIFYWTSAELLFFICIPLQVLVIMWYALEYVIKKKKKSKPQKESKKQK